MGSISRTSVMVQKTVSSSDNPRELTRVIQQLAPERENQNWDSKGYWCHEGKNFWFRPNKKLILPEKRKFPLLTTIYELNHWSTDQITFMNQYWWGNTDKSAKSAYLICSICPKFNPGKPIPDILIYPVGHSALANGFHTIASI